MSAPSSDASLLGRADPGLPASSGQSAEHIQVHAEVPLLHRSSDLPGQPQQPPASMPKPWGKVSAWGDVMDP